MPSWFGRSPLAVTAGPSARRLRGAFLAVVAFFADVFLRSHDGEHPQRMLAMTKATRRASGGARYFASSIAISSQKAPARGPPLHSPSDSPGRLSQRNASTSSSPVSKVGGLPILRPGGLHHS